MSDLDWQLFLANQIRESKKITKTRDPKGRKWAFSQSPNYRVFETSPSQKLDKGKTYLISGNEATIMLQASLIKASHDILGQRLGYTIDFDQWFEDFSLEFKKNPITGEYREGAEISSTSDEQALKYWGVPYEQRPKFKWIEPSPTATDEQLKNFNKLGYSVIKFWKNRTKENEYIFLSGTLTEIRQQLIDLMRTPEVNISGKPGYGGFISNKGKPKVVLYFEERLEDVEDGYRQIDAELTFRLYNMSENWEDTTSQNLTLNFIEQLATRIKNELFLPTSYKFKKGKLIVSYRDKKKGMQSYSYFYTKQDGIATYQKICNIAEIQYEPKFCKFTDSEDVTNAYPTIPPPENVLGQTVRAHRVRPVGDVYFKFATLNLASLNRNITLVSSDGTVFDANQFDLAKYRSV